MADRENGSSRKLPSGRLSRLAVFGKIAGGVAGQVAVDGARRLARGERPKLQELMLTPGNAARVADQLAHLRGAAMKLGQMISMDAGDILPAELSAILARLRDRAHHMPPAQLQKVLASHWGPDWRRRFAHFGALPVAAASIGQVHRARTHDGRELAIKVQYPGVADSIDADIDNVATLLRLSGLLPDTLDIAPLLAEAKRQLHEEADYVREGALMDRFGALLAEDAGFVVPHRDEMLSGPTVLAMDFIPSVPIERLMTAPQAERDAVMTRLVALVLRELFTFGLMQTDPNFANYRYQPDTERLVLLDFGAARPVPDTTVAAYRRFLSAGLSGDVDAIRAAAIGAGFVGEAAATRHRPILDAMIRTISGELNRPGPFDFGDRAFVGVLKEQGMAIATDRAAWHLPPVDTLFVQRKISGTALLAAQLKARVDVRALLAAHDIGSEH